MFIFDLLKRDDRRLQAIAMAVALGMFVLLAGLWFVQVVASKHFEQNLQKQSLKTIRIPALRGKILDRNGQILAENHPRYNAILYLEDMQDQFDFEYTNTVLKEYVREHPEVVRAHGKISLTNTVRSELHLRAEYRAVSNIAARVGTVLQTPVAVAPNVFKRHYASYPYVPFPLLADLQPRQVAIFSEQLSSQVSVDLETQPVRDYPHGTAAANLLGYVRPYNDEDISFKYSLPDYEGKSGIEGAFDQYLRGQPGVKSVLVNNQSYRQRENIASPTEPGDDICLTIDLGIQQAAEAALAGVFANTRGAAVVMDVNNGDILAMASSPTFNPNSFATRMSGSEWARLMDEKNKPLINRATYGSYPPGSTFKIITAIACLENGLDPNAVFDSPGVFTEFGHHVNDTAPAGKYNFERAFYLSSNTYFCHYGMKAGLRKILEVAKRFHLGERTDFPVPDEEVAGNVPSPDRVGVSFQESSAPDVCIGQEIFVTPLQMTALTAAIANGGTLFWPRVVSHLHSPDTDAEEELFPAGRVRDHVHINPKHLEIIRHAMLEDTEYAPDAETPHGGSGYHAFHHNGAPYLPFRVAGKTGTAQVKSPKSSYYITWFVSYAPFDNPRYAVVVMVEFGGSGGETCAPVARKIYEAIAKEERSGGMKKTTLAKN